MNRQELADCFDSMSPTEEQRERMLSAIMSKKSEPVRVYRFPRYMSVAVAAVVAVGVFAAVYPSVRDKGILTDNTVTELAIQPETGVAGEEVKNIETSDNVIQRKTENKPVSESIKKEYKLPEPEQNTQTYAMTEKETATEHVPEDMSDEKDAEYDTASEETYPVSMASEMSFRAICPEEVTEEIAETASGSGSAALTFELLTLEQIMADETCGQLFPEEFVEGFDFVSARRYNDGRTDAEFGSADGRYMSVEITKDIFNTEVIEPDEILSMNPEYGYMRFAVECGEYYVIYNAETDNTSEIHKMVTSSAWFTK